jgi:hypothetical protein
VAPDGEDGFALGAPVVLRDLRRFLVQARVVLARRSSR